MAARGKRVTELAWPADLALFNVAIERDEQGEESANFTVTRWTKGNLRALEQFLDWVMPTNGIRCVEPAINITASSAPPLGAVPANIPLGYQRAAEWREYSDAILHAYLRTDCTSDPRFVNEASGLVDFPLTAENLDKFPAFKDPEAGVYTQEAFPAGHSQVPEDQ